MHKLFSALFLFVFLITFFISCEPEETPPLSGELEFSTDTVRFDTLFTQIGSPTLEFKVYNPHNRPLKLESISLASGNQSPYHLNIDGISDFKAGPITIRPHDSLYIFVEITINKNEANEPVKEEDAILFSLKDQHYEVKLISWGQDVYLHKRDTLKTTEWTNDKPHLVYDYVYVDSAHTLTLKKGTRIYFHNKAAFRVKGALIAEGTYDDPVVFQSDRKDELYPGFSYSKVPGQWQGITLLPGSGNHQLNYIMITNATSGIKYLNNKNARDKNLQLSNSIIRHCSLDGLALKNIQFVGYNNELTSCGRYTIWLAPAGDYKFYHCTIANFWNSFSSRTTPSFYLDHATGEAQTNTASLLTANSIIYGNHYNELSISDTAEKQFSYNFDHCFIRLPKDSPYLDSPHFNEIYTEADSLFKNPKKDRYELDTLSPAKDKGKMQYAHPYPFDIKGNSRTFDQNPDLGAYERQD